MCFFHKNHIVSRDFVSKNFRKNHIPEFQSCNLHLSLENLGTEGSVILASIAILEMLTQQKPKIHLSKTPQARFKLQKGSPTGISIFLSKKATYYFIDKFFKIILPSRNEFIGVKTTSIDKQGNLNIRLQNCPSFPEMESEYQNIIQVKSITNLPLDLSFKTTCSQPKEAGTFFSAFQLPLKKF